MVINAPVFSSLFDHVPLNASEEEIKVLAESSGLVVERIVSHGHKSSEWYDQDEVEFCCVVRGAADLLFEGSQTATRMNAGDWALIPKHARHKVTWTLESEPTIWLAVKWRE